MTFFKVWWLLSLFLDILSVSYIYIHIHTVHSSCSICRGLSPFLHCLLLRGKNFSGVLRLDSNSGLTYSRPAHYELSYAVSLLQYTKVVWGPDALDVGMLRVMFLPRSTVTTVADLINKIK
jgi:hypothetical protein